MWGRSCRFHLISIHALREESDAHVLLEHFGKQISIHALREESDDMIPNLKKTQRRISIHALREESDQFLLRFL